MEAIPRLAKELHESPEKVIEDFKAIREIGNSSFLLYILITPFLIPPTFSEPAE